MLLLICVHGLLIVVNRFQKGYDFSVGGKMCTAKVDMVLMKREDSAVFVFEEV
jgi:hypothetical protein